MSLIKKALCILLAGFILALGVACGVNSGSSGVNGNGGGGNNAGQTETAKIAPTLLDGKVANFLGTEGIAIEEKKEKRQQMENSSSQFSAPKTKSSLLRAVAAYAEDGETINAQQKETELVKDTEDGVYDICFHDIEGEGKSYRDLNKKFAQHHHDGKICDIEDCARISDEIKEEEKEGKVDTVMSLDARVNKLYTAGNFTFMSVSSAVKGKYSVRRIKAKMYDFVYWGKLNGFPTQINSEFVESVEAISFCWIAIEDGGMIPIKVMEDEEEYHTSNYWSDDYNQSYIIDNETGVTYSLSYFKHIYSVSGGVIKIYNEQAAGRFDYYRPEITENGIDFVKYEVYETVAANAEIMDKISGNTNIDIYGNIVFDTNYLGSGDEVDENGEMKIGDKMILAQKSRDVYQRLSGRVSAQEYLMARRYHKGSDGRIYRLNYKGDMINVSVNVLDKNCVWQPVEKDVSVNFDIGDGGYIAWRIGENIAADAYYRITCISGGHAYYSTAACFDGSMTVGRAYYRNIYEDSEHFIGVIKISTDGEDYNALEFKHELFAHCGNPLNNPYSVILVGKTQMIYFSDNAIYLWNLISGESKRLDFEFNKQNGYYCLPQTHNNLYVAGLGYLNLEKETDFENFGENSFTEEPVYREVQFDEYYNLIIAE